MSALASHFTPQRRHFLFAAGVLLAIAAPFAAPQSAILPAPDTPAAQLVGIAVLAAAFALGYALPRTSLYLLVLAVVLEGAVRKWLVNDVVVFLLKDFLALGMYAAVLPGLTRAQWRRPPLLVASLAALVLLAVVYAWTSDSPSEAAIGLRAYVIYVPLIWVAPILLDTQRRVLVFLALVLAIGVVESALAALQTLTANLWLNEPIPGALPALIVFDGIGWIRPTGTMATVGTLSAFLLFPVLIAFALVMRTRQWPAVLLTLGAISVLTWGVVYSGSRQLAATIALAAVFLFANLAWHRRFFAAAGVVAAVALGYLVLAHQPWLGGAVREGKDSHFLRNVTYTYVDTDGKVKSLEMSIHRGDARATRRFVERAGGTPQPGTDAKDMPRNRLESQLRMLREQGIVGHGTGSMSLGSQYLQPVRTEAGESQYVRVAYELGIPGLIVFVVFLVAVWTSSAWGSFVALEWRRPAALVGLAAATFVPALSVLTYAFDYPAVSILYYTFVGCATAWASAVRATKPTPTALGAPRGAASSAASPGRA